MPVLVTAPPALPLPLWAGGGLADVARSGGTQQCCLLCRAAARREAPPFLLWLQQHLKAYATAGERVTCCRMQTAKCYALVDSVHPTPGTCRMWDLAVHATWPCARSQGLAAAAGTAVQGQEPKAAPSAPPHLMLARPRLLPPHCSKCRTHKRQQLQRCDGVALSGGQIAGACTLFAP